MTDDGLRMVMLTVFLVVAGGMTIWMRSSPGRVADRIGRVSSIDWWEKLATARARRISFSKESSGRS